jgi:uncharacterized protein (TIGR02001 family)
MATSWKRRSLVTLALCALAAPPALAQGRSPSVQGYATLANDYRHRGLSQLASGASLQVGADYEHASGFFAGGYAANVEYAVEAGRSETRDSVVDVYAGFSWGQRKWAFNVALGRYVYPNVDYGDYTELTFGVTFSSRLSYMAGYVDRMYSRPYSAWNHEVVVAQPLPRDFELSIALGQFESDPIPDGGYTHWNVGVSKVLRRVGLDLRFYEATLERASFFGDPGGDQWVLSVSYGFPSQ